jgi:hypothetical protein
MAILGYLLKSLLFLKTSLPESVLSAPIDQPVTVVSSDKNGLPAVEPFTAAARMAWLWVLALAFEL